VALLKNLYIS